MSSFPLSQEAAAGDSWRLLSLCVVALVGVLLIVVGLYRSAWMRQTAEAKTWERRARAAGWCPVITPEIAERIKNDLFPRPMGARGWDDAASLSTARDVASLRAWRERRAVTGCDHTKRHFAEGVTDSECAREILQFTMGGYEVDE